MITHAERALNRTGHCGETEPCVDDAYCNCSYDRCRHQACHRPGCRDCGKIHVGDRRWLGLLEHRVTP